MAPQVVNEKVHLKRNEKEKVGIIVEEGKKGRKKRERKEADNIQKYTRMGRAISSIKLTIQNPPRRIQPSPKNLRRLKIRLRRSRNSLKIHTDIPQTRK